MVRRVLTRTCDEVDTATLWRHESDHANPTQFSSRFNITDISCSNASSRIEPRAPVPTLDLTMLELEDD